MKNERWILMMTADNAWLPRSELLASHQKMVAEVDMKEALASGQFRPLVRKEIESHCANFGLDASLARIVASRPSSTTATHPFIMSFLTS